MRRCVCVFLLQVQLPLFARLFSLSDCELRFTIDLVSEKSSGEHLCKMFTLRVNSSCRHLFHAFHGFLVLFLFFGFAMSSTMTWGRPLLDYVVRDRVCIKSQFVKLSSGFAVNQALSASAVHNSLIPMKKTVRTLYFWYSLAQLE